MIATLSGKACRTMARDRAGVSSKIRAIYDVVEPALEVAGLIVFVTVLGAVPAIVAAFSG